MKNNSLINKRYLYILKQWIVFSSRSGWRLKLGKTSAIHLRAKPNSRKLLAKWLTDLVLYQTKKFHK